MVDGAERMLQHCQRPQCLAGMSHDVSYRVQNTLPTPRIVVPPPGESVLLFIGNDVGVPEIHISQLV